jgi:PDZ domain
MANAPAQSERNSWTPPHPLVRKAILLMAAGFVIAAWGFCADRGYIRLALCVVTGLVAVAVLLSSVLAQIRQQDCRRDSRAEDCNLYSGMGARPTAHLGRKHQNLRRSNRDPLIDRGRGNRHRRFCHRKRDRGRLSVMRKTSMPQKAATAYQRNAHIGFSALALFVAIGLGTSLQALAATLPVTLNAAWLPHNNGPFYFWRGMDLHPVIRSTAAVTGFRNQKGMVVKRVLVDSPAAYAGLKPGDIVSSLDGMPVGTARSLALAIADHCCGPTVRLRVWRDNHALVVELPSVISRSERTAARNRGARGGLLRSNAGELRPLS